jgi:actin-related protein 4
MLKSSISKCDIDLQPQFESSVVLTGANTLLHGFADRVYMEMHHATAGARIKIHAAGGSTERKFGPWIGGSILASLDNFAPLWISKEQYDEEGVRVESKIY